MSPVRISKSATQAFGWLRKMGIEVKPAIESGEMYEFEYENTYLVEYIEGALAYVEQVYVRPANIRKLRRYHLQQMLDEIIDVHNTFLTAAMIAAAPFEDWFSNK